MHNFWKMLAVLTVTALTATAPAAPVSASKTAKVTKLEGKIAFSLSGADGSEIYVMNADGTNRTRLTDGKYDGSPNFSPDGKQITYVGWNEPDTTPQIYVMNADGNNIKGLTYIWNTDSMGDFAYNDPYLSPDGTQIVYTGGNGAKEINRINADGTGLTTLVKSEIEGTGHIYPQNFSPSFSSDGKRIVFVSDRNFSSWGSSNEIYVMDSDGTNQTRITKNDYDDGSPCFSPDGKQIAFTSVRAGKSQIFVMNADGTNAIQLTRDGANSPCFSPDGQHIVYGSGSPSEQRIFIMNSDGTAPRKLTKGYHPTWALGFVPKP